MQDQHRIERRPDALQLAAFPEVELFPDDGLERGDVLLDLLHPFHLDAIRAEECPQQPFDDVAPLQMGRIRALGEEPRHEHIGLANLGRALPEERLALFAGELWRLVCDVLNK